MTERRNMTAQDWAVTAMSIGVCIFIGLILTTLVALMFQGLWVLLIFAIPFLIAQFLFEGAVRGLWYGGRRLLGYPPKAPEADPTPDPAVPWLRANSGWIGIAIGAAAATVFGDVWRMDL